METLTSDAELDPPAAVERASAWRRPWTWVSLLLGLLVWYPAGWGPPGLFPPAFQLLHGDTVFFGSLAAATAASLVVQHLVGRVAVVAVASLVLWSAATPIPAPVAHEEALVGGLLLGGQVLGLVAGTVLRRGPVPLALGLALVAASSNSGRWTPLLLVAAMAVPALRLRATSGRVSGVAAAVGGALGALVTWLVLMVLHFAIGYGWGDVRRGSGYPTEPRQAVRRVLEPALDFLRDASDTLVGIVLRDQWVTLVAGVVVAAGVVVVRLADRPDAGRETAASA